MKITIDGETVEIDSKKVDSIYEEIKEEVQKKIDLAESRGDMQYLLLSLACYCDVSKRLFESTLVKHSRDEIFEIILRKEC